MAVDITGKEKVVYQEGARVTFDVGGIKGQGTVRGLSSSHLIDFDRRARPGPHDRDRPVDLPLVLRRPPPHAHAALGRVRPPGMRLDYVILHEGDHDGRRPPV